MKIKQEKTLDDFRYMEQLELKYYSEEHVTPYREAYLWHLSNPKTGFVLEDRDTIVAFTDILPLKRDIVDKILCGTYNDKYLTADDMVPMEGLKAGDAVDLLLSCILVDEEYRDTDALKKLLNAHLDYYREFAGKGIRIDAVITSNVTREGERFSERMGFERVVTSDHQTAIYRTSFQEFDLRVRKMRPRLERLIFEHEKNLLLQSAGSRNVEIRDFTIDCLNRDTVVACYTVFQENGEKDGVADSSPRTSFWIREDGSWKPHSRS